MRTSPNCPTDAPRFTAFASSGGDSSSPLPAMPGDEVIRDALIGVLLGATTLIKLYPIMLAIPLWSVRNQAGQIAALDIAFDPIIGYLPGDGWAYFQSLAPDFGLLLQEGADLSERLNNAMTHCQPAGGYQQAVIMDSDSPALPADCLRQAFAALGGDVDACLGPGDDEGYYLIGLKRPAPYLFLTVTMSTPNVVADSLARAQGTALNVTLLPTSYDIDYITDLGRLKQDFRTLPEMVAWHTRQFLAAARL